MPVLAERFGIRPWEIDRLTLGEVAVLMGAIKADRLAQQRAAKAAKAARRR